MGYKGQSAWNKGKSVWTEPQDEFLQRMCQTMKSYGDIAIEFNVAFPDAPKTRNAILGRATRKGYRGGKPKPPTFGVTTSMQKVRSANISRARAITAARNRKVKDEARNGKPVVFDQEESVMLRHEGDRGQANSPTGSRRMSDNDPVVIERKKGMLPAIVESHPLTSVALVDTCSLSCMWPTNVECTEVCGAVATVGSYCARHAVHAYRIMPTAKRNRIRHKEDREHEVRIDGSHHRERLDPDGAWLQQQMLAMEAPSIDDVEEGNHPLFIPHFMDKAS